MTKIKNSGFTSKIIIWLALIALLNNVVLAAPPAPPELFVSVDDKRVSLIWNAVDEADGFTLFYAPYPNGKPIRSIELGNATIISADFPVGSAFFIALQSYNNEGNSDYSNLERFIVSDNPVELPNITFSFGDSVGSSVRSKTRIDALRTEAFFASQSLPKFQPVAGVHVYDVYEELLEAHMVTLTPGLASSIGLSIPSTGLTLSMADETWGGGTGQGQAFANHLFINASNSFWSTEASDVHKTRTIAHELFHVMQYQLTEVGFFNGANTNVPFGGPRWLIEGSAELAAYMMLDWAGLSDFDTFLQWAIDNAALSDYVLDEMENSPGFYPVENAYQIAFTAVSFLSRDLSKYEKYFSSISNEVLWEDAFFQAFEIDIETFYEEFKAYADSGY